jgi:FdhD protein
VTMRTPGADFELAAGLLFGEGIVTKRSQLSRIEYCVECEGAAAQQYNIVTAVTAPGTTSKFFIPGRTFGMTSACGLCGRERIDEIERRGIAPIESNVTVPYEVITSLPDRLRDAQGLFESTGGLHAAGLFDTDGNLLALREDVGRHNAVDKAIGWAFLEERLPLSESILMISGRGGFEIVQKAVAAGIPIVCAVSAPSSLAVDLARRFDQTFIGFLRGNRFNIYSSASRIALANPSF